MEGRRFIKSIRLKNILSYGPDTEEFTLEPLNILIGPNASGKSNLIEIIALLAATPVDLQHRILLGGGAHEWIWKGSEQLGVATIEVTVDSTELIKYRLSFTAMLHRFVLIEEAIEKAIPSLDSTLPYYYYRYHAVKPTVMSLRQKSDSESRTEHHLSDISNEELDLESSILSQRQGANPELTYLAHSFARIRFYRKRDFPLKEPPRQPGRLDSPRSFLSEVGHNLSSVMSSLLKEPAIKSTIMLKMKRFYPNIKDIVFDSIGNSIQMYLHESSLSHAIPTTKISDGSLRYLCLLAVLCHPRPPPIICIEEPEVGLHPDIMPEVADLLIDASKRSQIIVTTHSDMLVDSLTDVPESIVVCEKPKASTQLRRLEKDKLEVWLKKYRLGDLWTSGHLGGNRW